MPNPHLVETLFDRPIAFHRVFAKLTGSVNAGLMLSQSLFWSKRTKDEAGWFYKSQAEWEDEIVLTRREQDTARMILRKTRYDTDRKPLPAFWFEERRGIPARLYYRVDFDALLLHLQTYHATDAQKRQTEHDVQPDLTGLPSFGNAPKRQTRLAESAKLDATKPPNRVGTKRQTSMAESANHSLQRIQTKTTTKITNTNNNGRRRVSRSRAPRSAFTIAEWYAYAKTQANIKNKMAFANAMARTPEHDGTLRLHQEVQRQNNEPRPVSTAPVTHSDFWRLQLPRIQARLNAESFTTWFLPLDARQDNGTVILRAPDAVFQDWLEHNYADLMNEIGLLPRQWELP